MKYSKDSPSLKSLFILESIVNSNNGITLNEICVDTELSKSTVHRILSQLLDNYYILRKSDKYFPGSQLTKFAYLITQNNPIINIAEQALNRLNNETFETINLIGLNGFEGIYLDKKHAVNQVALRSKVGWTIPLFCTSGGKSLMAYQSETWLNDYFKYTKLNKFTERTVTDINQIKENLTKVRQDGFALDVSEHNADIVCIGAPIIGPEGEAIAAISISAPEYRFSVEKALSYKDLLIEETTKLTKRII